MLGSTPARLLGRLTAIAAYLLLCACGSSDDVELPVTPPLQSARISSYTGYFPGPWHQEIWIQLSPGVELAEIADLRVFGSLQPGMTIDQATAVMGPPLNRRGGRGEADSAMWLTEHGAAEVAYLTSCSGDDCYSYWRLQAHPTKRSVEAIFHPSIKAIVDQAIRQKPETEYRALHVDTNSYTDKLTLVIESSWDTPLLWHANHPPILSPQGSSSALLGEVPPNPSLQRTTTGRSPGCCR